MHTQTGVTRSTAAAIASLVVSVVLAVLDGSAAAADSTAPTRDATHAPSDAAEEPDQKTRDRLTLPETVVEGDRPFSAASSSVARRRDFSMRPIRRPADILESAPGLIVIQHAGGGKANQYYIRGFDNDHGTDLAISFDGIPVNNVSHAHGQGYADLSFVIPETVERLTVDKGPYFVEHGDFANAGAVDMVTRRMVEDNSVAFSVGRFDIYRTVAVGGGQAAGLDGLIAVEGSTQDGPFDQREDYDRYKLFTRAGKDAGAWSSDLTFTSYRGTWNASGQLPLREIRARRLDRFGSIDPTEGGTSQRHQLYGRTWWRPDADTEANAQVYGVYYDLDLFSNFTFFARDPVNGDQIEQKDKRWLSGGEVSFTKRSRLSALEVETKGGVGVRADDIDSELNYTRAREFLSRATRHHGRQIDSFAYGSADVTWTPWLRTIAGVRFDDLYLDVDNRMQRTVDPELRGEGRENATILSPKASVVLSPLETTDVYLNYGEGFHSNDARGVVRETSAVDAVAKSRGGEVGVRTRPFDRLELAAAIFLLDLESEIVFVGDEGTTEASGRTRRYGGELEIRYRILDWLVLDVDYTQNVAKFRDRPSDADEVPLAPRFTVTGGVTARRDDGLFGSLRVRSISARPATEDASIRAAGYTVWDLQIGKTWTIPHDWLGGRIKSVTTTVDIVNLFDQDYREAQFATASRLQFEPEPVEEIHFTPGYPLTAIGTISVAF